MAHAIDFFQSTLEMEQISGADSIESLFERVACCSYKTVNGASKVASFAMNFVSVFFLGERYRGHLSGYVCGSL